MINILSGLMVLFVYSCSQTHVGSNGSVSQQNTFQQLWQEDTLGQNGFRMNATSGGIYQQLNTDTLIGKTKEWITLWLGTPDFSCQDTSPYIFQYALQMEGPTIDSLKNRLSDLSCRENRFGGTFLTLSIDKEGLVETSLILHRD